MKKGLLAIALLFITITTITSQDNKQITMNIATFNIRMDTPNDGENAWPHRKEMVKDLINYHEFDIVGTQEAFKHQLDGILELDNYAYVGAGRDDGKDAGEHSAIIYRKDKLKVLDKGNFWLSETPEVPGKGWDATCCNRICSWAKFRDIKTGKELYVFNVHYDHQGVIARKNSSLLIIEKIKQIAKDKPTFCTGDFNATPNEEPIKIITENGLLKDSYHVTLAKPYGTEGTFNSFQLNAPMKNRIDYIWVTEGIKVNKYGVLNEQQYSRFPSDHFPVVINATF